MKKKIAFTVLVLVAALLPLALHAQNSLDPARLQAIRQNCATIQTILSQQQKRDLVTRTNRGRGYEAQNKQIDALQRRLIANNIASPALDPLVREYKDRVDAFRQAYVRYDDHMTVIRQVDCREKPDTFATLLAELKVMRQEVGVEVVKGDEVLARLRQSLVDLKAILPDARSEN